MKYRTAWFIAANLVALALAIWITEADPQTMAADVVIAVATAFVGISTLALGITLTARTFN